MSRHRPTTSYGHKISDLGGGCYRLQWTVDRYYVRSRLRHPTGCHRDVERDGAERFAKRWDVKMPENRS
ncbi:MAG: hypothetical protein O9972_39800 [Burkholderiales bacterium]|nr:hypothetical protein [Burkholderiales bacterium]